MNKVLWANIITMLMNIAYALIALIIGVKALQFIDKKIFPQIDFIEEIKKGNIAAAILAATILIFIAVVLGLVLS